MSAAARSNRATFAVVPNEVLLEVVLRCEVPDVLRCERVCLLYAFWAPLLNLWPGLPRTSERCSNETSLAPPFKAAGLYMCSECSTERQRRELKV